MNNFVTVAQASEISWLSPHYIRRLFNEWRIWGRIVDSHYYINRESLYEFLKKRSDVAMKMATIQQRERGSLLNTKNSVPKKEPSINDKIVELEARFSWDVLVYISQFWKDGSIIIANDWMNFDDFLNWMDAKFPWQNKKFKKIILYLSSPWGLLEASVKIVDIIRQYAESFEVVVPYMAKSAASLICLSSDLIHMTPISELWPIDPIIENPAKPWQMIPARAIDDFISYYSAMATSDWPLANSLSKIFENKIDPYLLWSWKNALRYSQKEIEVALSWKVEQSIIQNIVNNFTIEDISHSHPITYNDLNKMGIKYTKQISSDNLPCVKSLFASFNDYMFSNRLVKVIWNRYQCFNVQEITQNERK